MYRIVKNKQDLENYINEFDDFDETKTYLSMRKIDELCFAIFGCMSASEAYKVALANDDYCLVITDVDHTVDIAKQTENKNPEINGFHLKKRFIVKAESAPQTFENWGCEGDQIIAYSKDEANNIIDDLCRKNGTDTDTHWLNFGPYAHED